MSGSILLPVCILSVINDSMNNNRKEQGFISFKEGVPKEHLKIYCKQ